MRFNVFILLLLFTGSLFYPKSGKKWKWEKVNYSFPGDVYILSVASGNNFWLRTKEGNLIHYQNGKTDTYKTIISSEYSRFQFAALNQNEFLATAMDNKWRTHFYHFAEGKWEKDPFVFRLPVQSLTKINNKTVYATGNFGIMLKYENNNWTEIKTPFKSHIDYVDMASPKEIFLLTQSEGVYLFDGNLFKPIPFEEKNKWDVQGIRILSENKIFVRDRKRKIYRYKEGRFIQDNNPNGKALFDNPANPIYHAVVQKTDHHNELSITVPSIYKFIDSKSYHKDSILFSERGGTIYRAGVTNSSYFIDFSKVLGVIGGDFTSNYITAIYDFDNNGLLDIISVNQSLNESFTIFYNNHSIPFRKIIAPPISNEQVLGPSAAFLDYNCDSFTDFVITRSDTGGISLDVFENDKKGNFFKRKSVPLSLDNNLNAPVNLKPVDFDADGKMDLNLTYYYGSLNNPGYEIILKNSFFNGLGEIDSSYKKITRAWNRQSLFADFNNDDRNDWFIVNKWNKNKLLMRKDGKFIDESNKRILPLKLSETVGACAADFDNDGDLDILEISDHSFLSLFQNNAKGFFTDASEQVGLNKIAFGESILGFVSVTLGDFNNDGFTDIFLSDANKKNPRNFLLLNQHGKYFIDQTEEMQIAKPVFHSAIAVDIDNDGDIDILSYGINEYALWINNLDNKSYLKIKPRGVIANSDGWGTKIWIYEAGHLNDHLFLRGYKQLGSEIFGASQNCENIAHFGVDQNKLYDVKLKFYGGEEIILQNLKPGTTYNVNELNELSAFFYTFPRVVVRVLRSKEIQNYILITVLTFFILYVGTKSGLHYYRWNNMLSLGFVSLSSSLYWLILLLTINSPSLFLKYFLPALMSAASIAIPNLVFLWITRNHGEAKSVEKLKDELLDELMQFSHGAWALSNLNSLQLLYAHAHDNSNDPQYLETITERRITFNEMVQPRLTSIIDLSSSINLGNEHTQQLNRSLEILIDIKPAQGFSSYHEFATAIALVKESLIGIKRIVYATYSCDPITVIKNTCNSLESILTQNDVVVLKCKKYEDEHAVLIKNYELADIIDNCIQNSVRALKDTEKKKITITVYKSAPKICIDIADNGSGISKNEWEKIFESGYSNDANTGFGLFAARTKLKKYGGRIFVKSSIESEETIFTIELNEGILK